MNLERIEQLMSEKLDLLCEIYELSEKQKRGYESGDLAAMMREMDRRQSIIERVDKIDEEILSLCPQSTESAKQVFCKRLFPQLFSDIFAVLECTLGENPYIENRALELLGRYRDRNMAFKSAAASR